MNLQANSFLQSTTATFKCSQYLQSNRIAFFLSRWGHAVRKKQKTTTHRQEQAETSAGKEEKIK